MEMGRPLRIVIPGMAYHVMVRGNERKNIYREDIDRKKFLNLLKDAIKIYDFRLYAYTLMSNHYHNRIELKKVFGKDIIIRAICEYYRIVQEQLNRKGGWNSRKPIAYYLLSRDGGLKNTQISEIFDGIHPSVIGRRIKEIAAKVDRDNKLGKDLRIIRGKYGVKK
jgi:REP element-mobilizing transposase RayT